MRQVRWVLQASKPGANYWVEQGDRVYSGWFHSTGNDEPSPTVVAEYNKAVRELTHLDVRLVQEVRMHSRTILMAIRRDVPKEKVT